MGITVDFDNKKIAKLVEELGFSPEMLSDVFRDIAFLVENDVKDIIGSRKVDSRGRPWEKWTKGYAKRQARRGRRQPQSILLNEGTLRSSITSDYDSGEMNVGTNEEYAATQNDGDPSRNIVDREFLYIDDSLTEDILDIVEKELDRVAGRF